MSGLRAFSSGGGVQSTAALVLAAEGRIDFPLFIMANTGDDSERPATLRYTREVAMPFADAHGIEFVLLDRVMRGGGTRTLLTEMGAGGFGRKKCTERFKIAVVRAEMKRRGATVADPCTVGLGITTDEIDRAGVNGLDERDESRMVVYPLLTLGLSRQDCRNIITGAGLPMAPKSACKFCPLHDAETWRRMRREEPDDWATAVEVDGIVRERAVALGRGAMGLVHPTIALADAVDDQLALFGSGCESGWCMT